MEKKTKRGRPRLAKNWTAVLLAERSREYFDKCDARTKLACDKEGNLYDVPNPEPYSIEGLCVYLDITRREFDGWRKRKSRWSGRRTGRPPRPGSG